MATIFMGLFIVIIFRSDDSHDLVAPKNMSTSCPDDRPSWMKLKPEEMSAKELMISSVDPTLPLVN